MKKAALVLVPALLIALALWFHRSPREEKPTRPHRPEVVEIAAPEPEPMIVAPRPTDPPPLPPPKPPPAQPAVVNNPATGIVQGTVRIVGEIPRRRRANLRSDPKCAAMHEEGLFRDDIVADEEGFVRWAFVYLSQGVMNPTATPLKPALLDQVACRFEPHVMGLLVNQPLNIWNNDDLLHSVHSLPFLNTEFNFGQPKKGLFQTKTFSKSEVMVKIKCDIHPWMEAWVGVLEHPYFDVTSGKGHYKITDVPPGNYRVRVWHERYVPVDREVILQPGQDVRLDFVLDVKRD